MTFNRKEKLLEMLAETPGDSFLRYALCMEQIAEGHTTEAIAGLRALLQDNPDYTAAYYHLAFKLAETGNILDAIATAEAGLEITLAKKEQHAHAELRSLLDQIEDLA